MDEVSLARVDLERKRRGGSETRGPYLAMAWHAGQLESMDVSGGFQTCSFAGRGVCGVVSNSGSGIWGLVCGRLSTDGDADNGGARACPWTRLRFRALADNI